jgi:hypothetical protein
MPDEPDEHEAARDKAAAASRNVRETRFAVAQAVDRRFRMFIAPMSQRISTDHQE